MPSERTTVQLNFTGDTSQLRREVRQLDKAQQRSADLTEKSAARSSAASLKTLASIEKLRLGWSAVTGAIDALGEAAAKYAKRQQLVAASSAADIGRIKAASRGLLTETEAMSFASAALNTQFKLSQREMEIVARAMVSLRNQGNDWHEVQKRLNQAVVEGNAEALKPFGIVIRETTGTVKAHTAVMRALEIESRKATASQKTAGDEALQAQVAWADATDKFTDALGKLAGELAPVLDLLAEGTEGFAEFIRNAEGGLFAALEFMGAGQTFKDQGLPADATRSMEEEKKGQQEFLDRMFLRGKASAKFASAQAQIVQAIWENPQLVAEMGAAIEKFVLAAADDADERIKAKAWEKERKKREEAAKRKAEQILQEELERGRRFNQWAKTSGDTRRIPSAPPSEFDIGEQPGPNLKETGFALEKAVTALDAKQAKLPKIDPTIKGLLEANNAATTLENTFMRMADLIGGAFEEWASGAIGLKEALEKSARQAIAGELDLWAQKHFLMAAAALSSFNFPLAAGHTAAGILLKTGAGAIRGGGNASSSGALPGSARGPALAASQQASNREVIIVGGLNPYEDDPRGARRRMGELIGRVQRETGGDGTAVVRG